MQKFPAAKGAKVREIRERDTKKYVKLVYTLETKYPKRAVGGLIFRSGFRDVHKVAPWPSDFPAQSADLAPPSQSEKERSKNQTTHCMRHQTTTSEPVNHKATGIFKAKSWTV